MNFIRHLCKDTFDKCLIILHSKQGNKNTHEYSNVAHEMKESAFHHEEEEEEDNFAAWPTQKTETTESESLNPKESTSKKSQSTIDSDTSLQENRPILIGNLDEESISKKNDIDDKNDELFTKMNLNSGNSPTLVINKTVIDNKKASKVNDTKDRLEKFKMDEDLEPNDGWIDENEINI